MLHPARVRVWGGGRVGRDLLGTVRGEPRDGPRTTPEQTLGHNPKQQFNHWSASVPRVHVRNLPTNCIYISEWRMPFSGYKRTDTTTKKGGRTGGSDYTTRTLHPSLAPYNTKILSPFAFLFPYVRSPLSAANSGITMLGLLASYCAQLVWYSGVPLNLNDIKHFKNKI